MTTTSYDTTELVDAGRPPRWPWVVGVVAIIAAIALVVSVSLLVTAPTPTISPPRRPTTTSAPPVQDEITTTTPPPPPPPPPSTEEPAAATAAGDGHGDRAAAAACHRHRTGGAAAARHRPRRNPSAPPPPPTTTRAGPRQVTYSVTGTKAPGDIISVTYIDASGRSRTQRNVYIPWSLTVTPISQSEVGSVQASSLFLVSRLNCSITTSDGTVLSSNTSNSAQTSC